VLLVTHEASRTGAPRVAVEIARVLRADGDVVVTALRAPGPLSDEFARVSSAVVKEPLTTTRMLLRRFRRTRPLAVTVEEHAAAHLLRRLRPDVVFMNTVKSACYLRPALSLGVPAVLHVHEVEPLASRTLARYGLGEMLARATLAACSEDARANLAHLAGTASASVRFVPSVVDAERVVALSRASSTSSRRGFVVGACGVADQRKGVDLWLEMARLVCSRRPDLDVMFRWIGATGGRDVRAEARRLGLDAVVDFVGELPNPYPALASMDVFTLPSRADPFPLVVLEAMALSRAVVAFRLPGVATQLSDCGVLVDPDDVRGMAEAVVLLLDDAERRRALGARAQRRVRAAFSLERLRTDVNAAIEASRATANVRQAG
jgi:glycosyltransferase involved in cell wall biosynthesis